MKPFWKHAPEIAARLAAGSRKAKLRTREAGCSQKTASKLATKSSQPRLTTL